MNRQAAPCRRGPSCRYLQLGKCHYYHPDDRKVAVPKINQESPSYSLMQEAEKRLTLCRQEETKIITELNSINDQQQQLEIQITALRQQQQGLQQGKEVVIHQLNRTKYNIRQAEEHFLDLVKYCTPCAQSNKCPYYHQNILDYTVTCLYFHSLEEISEFKAQRSALIETEMRNVYEAKLLTDSKAEVEFYRTDYVYLGNRLKRALCTVEIPDEILNIIRNYCCDRLIKEQKASPDKGYWLVMCPSNNCSRQDLTIENDGLPNCHICKKIIDPYNYYILYEATEKSGGKYWAIFFHRFCINEWGLCIPGEDTTHTIKGDVIPLNSATIHLTKAPSNVCFTGHHDANYGDPIVLIDNKLATTNKDFCQECTRFTCTCPCKHCYSDNHRTVDHIDSDDEGSEPTSPRRYHSDDESDT